VSVSEDIYRELILQHSRHPRHFGDLADATHAADADNPLCGDSYQVRLKVEAGGVIREAAFEGSGCAISKASASLMLDAVVGRTSGGVRKPVSGFPCRGARRSAGAGGFGAVGQAGGLFRHLEVSRAGKMRDFMLAWGAQGLGRGGRGVSKP
jgi:hypothetical protein